MSLATSAPKVMTGATGNLWFYSTLMELVQSVELKLTGNFNEITACGTGATAQNWTGYSGTGSFKKKKTDSALSAAIAEEIQTGNIKNHTLNTEINCPTGGTERVRVDGLTFDEVTPVSFESGSDMEEEFPFHFTNLTFLDRIA